MQWIDAILNLLFPPPVTADAFRSLPTPKPHDHYPWIFSATRYSGNAKKIIKYIKETPDSVYVRKSSKMMGKTLESYVLELGEFAPESIVLVPVPQHTSRTRDRGFSQSELLARGIADLLPYAQVLAILQKTRPTEKQALLPRKQRLINQIDSFTCMQNTDVNKNSLVVIVDDVSTTGSTLNACKTALNACGFGNVIGLVFAH